MSEQNPDITPHFESPTSQPQEGETPEVEKTEPPDYVGIINELIKSGNIDTFSQLDHPVARAEAPTPMDLLAAVEKGGSRNFAAMVVVIDTKGIRRVVFAKQINQSRVEAELQAHEVATKAGVEHFVPYAYSKTGTESLYLTFFRKVLPLDRYRITDLERFKQVGQMMIRELKKLHQKGLRHCDAQARNFGLDPATVGTDEEVLLIYDFEDSRLYTTAEMDSDEFFKECQQEIHNALYALRHCIPDELRGTFWKESTAWACEEVEAYKFD